MGSSAYVALTSWDIQPGACAILLLTAIIYLRGWLLRRRLQRGERDSFRLLCFLSGLMLVFLATQSPLDSFDYLYLSAHMTQHLLLMMIAPPLLLLGDPILPMLRGLPRSFVKEALGPFLTFAPLRKFASWLVSPVVAWLLFAVSTIGWHVPLFYEMALRSPFWHGMQHASFFWTGILFWWPIVRPGPKRSTYPEWIGIPYLLFADIINTVISAIFVFSGTLLYPSYETVRLAGMSARDDQTLAGALMWVPGSIVYLLPTIALTMRVISGTRNRVHERVERVRIRERTFSLKRWRMPALRRVAQIVMVFVAGAVIADGLLGAQVTPLNLAGILPWIHWRALSLMALLLVGNLFCMACPFTFVRDLGRKVLPAKTRWPRALRNKWIPAGLFAFYLWAYEAFNLWDSPAATAWIIIGYFAAALVVDGFFRGASFCKYVCPIGQFHFVSSLVSPREVAVLSQAVCGACKTHDCIRGNAHVRGCELDLFQPKKVGNLDCTFCLDCVKACPHDNVALVSILPASTLTVDPYRSSIRRLSKRTDYAALALLIVFGAFVNAAGMVEPVMMWEHRWHARLGPHAMPLVVAAFTCVGLIIAPAIAVAIGYGASRLLGLKEKAWSAVRRFAFALVPLGIGMWAAHLLYHLATGWRSAWPAVQQAVWHQVNGAAETQIPNWLSPAQILILDAGFLLTLYVSWQVAEAHRERVRSAMSLFAPWAVLSSLLFAIGVWTLFQPMQMRGMMMH